MCFLVSNICQENFIFSCITPLTDALCVLLKFPLKKTWIVNFLKVSHYCSEHFSNMKHEIVYAYIQYNNLMYHELCLSEIFKLSDAWLINYNHTYLFSLYISELSKLPGRNRISRNTVSPNGLEMEFCDLISDDTFCFNFYRYLPALSVWLDFCSSYVADRLNFPSSCEHTQLRRDVPCPMAVCSEIEVLLQRLR